MIKSIYEFLHLIFRAKDNKWKNLLTKNKLFTTYKSIIDGLKISILRIYPFESFRLRCPMHYLIRSLNQHHFVFFSFSPTVISTLLHFWQFKIGINWEQQKKSNTLIFLLSSQGLDYKNWLKSLDHIFFQSNFNIYVFSCKKKLYRDIVDNWNSTLFFV